jgi:hypothetical protein
MAEIYDLGLGMPDPLRFPLFVLCGLGDSGPVFQHLEGEKRLPLFTSAESASTYRESLQLHTVQLESPKDLRDLLRTERESSGDFKIVVDPNDADAT